MANNLRGDARSGFAAHTRAVESGGNDSARATTSSASGRYQFTDDTFVGMFKEVYGKGKSRPQMLAMKNDTSVQEALMAASEKVYTKTLSGAGLAADDTNKYLSHFFGPERAVAVLRSNHNAQIESLVGAKAVAANKSVLHGKTVGEVVGWARNKMGQFPGKYNNKEPLPTDSPLADYDSDSFYDHGLGVGPMDARRPLGPDLRNTPSKIAKLNKQMVGLEALRAAIGTPDKSIVGRAAVVAEGEQAKADVVKADSYTSGEKFVAAFQENSIGAAIYRALDKEHTTDEEGHAADYAKNIDTYEAGMSYDERKELRDSGSKLELTQIQDRIKSRRKNNEVIFSGGTLSGSLWSMAGGIADPVNLALGIGTGGAFSAAGIGARGLYAAGRTGLAVGSLALEGAVGGGAGALALDGLGEHITTKDYAQFMAFGAVANTAFAPLSLRGGKMDRSVQNYAAQAAKQSEVASTELRARAVDNLQRKASPEEKVAWANMDQEFDDDGVMSISPGDGKRARSTTADFEVEVGREMKRLDGQDEIDKINAVLAPVADNRKLFGLSEDGTMHVTDPDKLAEVTTRLSLDAISDPAERAAVAEYNLRAERIVAENPVDHESLKTSLSWANLESTGNILLSSDNPMAKAFGIVLLENSQGAAGRKATGAMIQNMREQVYMRHLGEFEDLYTAYRKGEGVGVWSEAFHGNSYREFNRKIFSEIEARGKGASTETNALVRKAADAIERGYDTMRVDQQTVGTIGHARLGTFSTGYQPHRISGNVVAGLAPDQHRAVRKILSRQFQEENGFDEAFSDKLAAKYLQAAQGRAMGGYDVPMHLHDPASADIIWDAAKAMNLSTDEADKLLGKFSRGGAGHTKARLKMDLSEAIPDGKGGEMPLSELFNQDAFGMYRGYARRVSGEVALAKYGILGKKGLETYRQGLMHAKVSKETLDAFDQVSAEFLNTPFGEHQHKYMDNLRIMTSLARLGGMGFTQLGEYGNAIAAIGVGRTLSAMGSFRRLAKEVGQLSKGANSTSAILGSIDRLGGSLGIDQYNTSRLFDVPDQDIQIYSGENIGFGTRALRAAGNLQATLSAHRIITAVQIRGMAEQINSKAWAFVKSGADDTALNDMGLDEALRGRLKANIDKLATFNGDGSLKSLDIQAGDLTPDEITQYVSSVQRGASQIIQRTYIGETGKWAHNGFLKLLTQFRTFSLISVEKQWGRGVKNGGGGAMGNVRAFATLMGAMSFAVPIHLARLQVNSLGMSRAKREKYLDDNMGLFAMGRSVLGYASKSGLGADVLDMGTGLASGWSGQDLSADYGIRGQAKNMKDLIPGLGMADDLLSAAQGDTAKLVKSAPYGRLPFVIPLINGITPDK